MKYTINSTPISKEAFFASLRTDCVKAVAIRTAGNFEVEVAEFDRKRYQHILRNLRAGHIVLMEISGKSYRSSRK